MQKVRLQITKMKQSHLPDIVSATYKNLSPDASMKKKKNNTYIRLKNSRKERHVLHKNQYLEGIVQKFKNIGARTVKQPNFGATLY